MIRAVGRLLAVLTAASFCIVGCAESCRDRGVDPWPLGERRAEGDLPADAAESGRSCSTGSDAGGPDVALQGRNCGCLESCEEKRCQSNLAETWRGKYTCTQGVTGLTLTVTGPGDELRATFEFYSVPENPGVPTGAFRMTGQMDCDRNFELRPDEWIDRPAPHWDMVGLEGTFHPNRPSITGNVIGGTACDEFEIGPAD